MAGLLYVLSRCPVHTRAAAGFLLFFLLFSTASAQIAGWQQQPLPFTIARPEVNRDYSLPAGFFNALTKTAINTYWIFFSELDGDRCPFHPTCSNFLVSSVKEEGIVQGYLMFVDRFIRDSNPVGRGGKYPLWGKRNFFDPPGNYSMQPEKFMLYPAGRQVPQQ